VRVLCESFRVIRAYVPTRMEPDMSKKEVAVIEWLDIETLKHLLATPLDRKTMKKPWAGRNIRGRPWRNTRPSSATPRRTSRAVK
jgi:hypothetical protein